MYFSSQRAKPKFDDPLKSPALDRKKKRLIRYKYTSNSTDKNISVVLIMFFIIRYKCHS